MGCQMQIYAIGTQGLNLVAQSGDCLSFWRTKYALICNSCINSVEHQFQGQPGFNKWNICNLIRQGDLIKSMQAVFRVPGLAPCGEDDWAHWNAHLSYLVAQEIQFELGGTLLARAYGDSLRIQQELIMPAGTKEPREIVGSVDVRTALIDNAQYVSRLYYLGLNCWIDWVKGNALPMAACQQQTFTIRIQTSPLNLNWYSGPVGLVPLALTTAKGQYSPLSDQSLDGFIYVDWVQLEDRERENLEDEETLTYLMYQVQRQQTCLTCQTSLVLQNVPITFNHPVFLLAWYIVTTDAVYRKDVWNWSGHLGIDPAISFQLKSSSDQLFSERDAVYFRTVVSALGNLNVPRFFVYIWSFAIFPFAYQPSNFINLSRVNDLALYLRLQPQLREVLVTIIAWNYNWLNISDQYGTAEFAGC